MNRILTVLLLTVLGLQLPGCATTTGGETLKIDARNVQGMQHVPDELTDMLRELGYDWIGIKDSQTHRRVKTVQKDGEYLMRFEYLETRQLRIDVRIRRQDGFTWLHVYEPDKPMLSPSSATLFEKLKMRAEQEFGAVNVRN
jgi:hypothetical protein